VGYLLSVVHDLLFYTFYPKFTSICSTSYTNVMGSHTTDGVVAVKCIFVIYDIFEYSYDCSFVYLYVVAVD